MILGVQPRDKVTRDMRDMIVKASGAEQKVILWAQPREEVMRVVLDETFGDVWTYCESALRCREW